MSELKEAYLKLKKKNDRQLKRRERRITRITKKNL